MDEVRFDLLVKSLAADAPRRRVLAATLATVVGGLVLPRRAVAKKCKKPGQGCNRDNDCCRGAECKNGACKCKDGRTKCDRKCKNLDNDEKHCGACENRCAVGQTCCDGACTDFQFDDANCGSCGAPCGPTAECLSGVCTVPTGGCAPGADSCATEDDLPCGAAGLNCECSRSTEGATLCGQPISGVFCGQCASSADCARFGPGAFCAASMSIAICCGPSLQNVCRLACA